MIDEKLLIETMQWKMREAGTSDWNRCLDEVEMFIREFPQVGGWIPVTEKLPEESGNYLVTSKGSTWVANWFNGAWWGIEKKCRCTDVEAWRPLPEPYKESEQE